MFAVGLLFVVWFSIGTCCCREVRGRGVGQPGGVGVAVSYSRDHGLQFGASLGFQQQQQPALAAPFYITQPQQPPAGTSASSVLQTHFRCLMIEHLLCTRVFRCSTRLHTALLHDITVNIHHDYCCSTLAPKVPVVVRALLAMKFELMCQAAWRTP